MNTELLPNEHNRYINELRQRIVAEYSICQGYDDFHRKEIEELIKEYTDAVDTEHDKA